MNTNLRRAITGGLILLWTITAAAIAVAEDVPLPDGTLLTLVIPPGDGDRFQHAEFSLWVPDPKQPVQAVIIHQHGCPNASPDKHPPVTLDFHWRALARKHRCALLAPQYQVAGNCDEWNDPESGSERALFAALGDFGKRAERPELARVPWILWGHSGGSSWSAQMIVRHPGRVLAASFRGGCHKQFGVAEFRERFVQTASLLPLLFVWGKRESVPASSHYVSWVPMNAMFAQLRSAGGRVARVIDPKSEHGCDNSRLIVMPFFDAVLSAHAARQSLNGVLVDIETSELRAMTDANLSDFKLAWLPSPELGRKWREFSETGSIKPPAPPQTAPVLQAAALPGGGIRLNWLVEPEVNGGLRALRIWRNGQLWQQLGVKSGDPVATSRDAPPEGLRETSLTDDGFKNNERVSYALSFLDSAGNESPRSVETHSDELQRKRGER